MLSYFRGPDFPLSNATIWSLLEGTAARFPNNFALVVKHQDLRLTYAGLKQRVEQVARGMVSLGLGRGDRVGIWATNCAEWVLVEHACARIGAVLVNVNPAYRSYELGHVLKRSRMKALFLWERDRRADYRSILEEARASLKVELANVIYFGAESWSELLESDAQLGEYNCSPREIANIQYTSGTTGSPKGVLLSHYNLVNNAFVCASSLSLTAVDKICLPLPLYHCFGCVIGGLAAVSSGAALVLPAPSFDALSTLRTIEEEGATAVYGVPTMFIAEVNHPEFSRFDLRSLRTGVMGGAPCPIEVMKRVITDMHCPELTIMYGQTESSPTMTVTDPRDTLDNRVSTVGRPCPNTEVKIVAPGTGETVPVGVQGEVRARGYLVMEGYDQDPEATSRAIDADGWLHTGDLGQMRADGYLMITGRAKDMIIRGGENIYPREVEEFLHTHPKIAEVHIIGVPDERLGEAVAAWIRLRQDATQEEIVDFCKNKIAHFKIPQHIRFVESFPTTVTGKVQKFRMREIEMSERAAKYPEQP